VNADPPLPPPTWIGRTRPSLLAGAIGGPGYNARKLRSSAVTLAAYAYWPTVRGRLERLVRVGLTESVPTFSQLMVGGQHMMLGAASDETRLFYESQGIGFTFHNFRRFVDYPATMMDPVGFFADRDAIIHHILSTTHRHPVYDFQLLLMFDDGLGELLRRVELAARGQDRDQTRLDQLVEDPTYYARLLPQTREFCADPTTATMALEYAYSADPHLMLAMDQFKDVPGFVRYAGRLPARPRDVGRAVSEEIYKATLGRILTRPGVAIRYDCCDPALIDSHFPGGLNMPGLAPA